MAGDQGVIDDRAAVADPGVVADVAADHEHVAVADPGRAVSLHGPAMDGDELAEDVAVADPDRGRLALIAAMLGALAQHGAVADDVVPAQGQGSAQAGVGLDDASGADLDGPLDHRVRADPDIRRRAWPRGRSRPSGGSVPIRMVAIAHLLLSRRIAGTSCLPASYRLDRPAPSIQLLHPAGGAVDAGSLPTARVSPRTSSTGCADYMSSTARPVRDALDLGQAEPEGLAGEVAGELGRGAGPTRGPRWRR